MRMRDLDPHRSAKQAINKRAFMLQCDDVRLFLSPPLEPADRAAERG